MDPVQHAAAFLNIHRRAVQPISSHGKIASKRIHFNAGFAVFIPAFGDLPAKEQMQAFTRRTDLDVCRCFRDDRGSRFVQRACVLVPAMVDIHTDEIIVVREHKPKPGIPVPLTRCLCFCQRSPCTRIGGRCSSVRVWGVWRFIRPVALAAWFQPPADPLPAFCERHWELFRFCHASPPPDKYRKSIAPRCRVIPQMRSLDAYRC